MKIEEKKDIWWTYYSDGTNYSYPKPPIPPILPIDNDLDLEHNLQLDEKEKELQKKENGLKKEQEALDAEKIKIEEEKQEIAQQKEVLKQQKKQLQEAILHTPENQEAIELAGFKPTIYCS